MYFFVLCLINDSHNACMHRGIHLLTKYNFIHFDSEAFLLACKVLLCPFTKGMNGLSHVYRILNTLLSAVQLHHLFFGSVLVFEKRILHLQMAVSTSGKSFCSHSALIECYNSHMFFVYTKLHHAVLDILRVYIHYGEAILGLNNRTRHPICRVRFWWAKGPVLEW